MVASTGQPRDCEATRKGSEMAGMTRRDLLQAAAGAGALALGSDPLVQQALAARGPGKLTDIEHVVILIQENRSFDHYFGTLPGVRGFSDASAPRRLLPAGLSRSGL